MGMYVCYSSPQYHKHFKYWATGGEQFLPPVGHKHYDLLQLKFYELNFDDHVFSKIYSQMNDYIFTIHILFSLSTILHYFQRQGNL